jgi:ubiquinone/menaquinone biosynthesis C-methylase UbiE
MLRPRATYRRLLRFGFRLLYNEMAWTYDAVSWIVSAGEWRAWQRSALGHLNAPPGALVLELAHGTANLQRDLRAAGFDTIGLDLSKAMGRIARRKLRRAKLTPKLVQGDARRLPFNDGQFAAIVCTFPTEFIVDPAVIGETYRVLQPCGRLVFVPSAVFSGRGAAKSALEAAYRVTGQRGNWPSDVLSRFEVAGFTLTSHAEPCTISVAQVMVAHK